MTCSLTGVRRWKQARRTVRHEIDTDIFPEQPGSQNASVVLPSAAHPDEFVRELPERVKFDAAADNLTLRGAMQLGQFGGIASSIPRR